MFFIPVRRKYQGRRNRNLRGITRSGLRVRPRELLSLVFPLINPFEHGKSRFFGVGDRERLELDGRIEGGKDLAHRFLAGRAIGQRLRRERPTQREFAAAHLASALAQFVFVNRHY
jgi:hypothetical protein